MLVGEVAKEAPHQLVGQRTLAGAAGAGDAEDRHGRDPLFQVLTQRVEIRRLFLQRQLCRRDQAGHGFCILLADPCRIFLELFRCGEVALPELVVDHSLQAQLASVLRGENLADAVVVELLDLVWDDDPATSAEDFDMRCISLLEQVVDVFEKLKVPALVGADGDPLGIFVDGRRDDLVRRAIVSEMHDLGTGVLQQAAHDVDRNVMTVVKTGRGYETDWMLWLIRRTFHGHLSSWFTSKPPGLSGEN